MFNPPNLDYHEGSQMKTLGSWSMRLDVHLTPTSTPSIFSLLVSIMYLKNHKTRKSAVEISKQFLFRYLSPTNVGPHITSHLEIITLYNRSSVHPGMISTKGGIMSTLRAVRYIRGIL